MQRVKTGIAFMFTFLVFGCASAPLQVPFTDIKRGETEVGTSSRAFVGDTIYRKFDIKEQYEGYVSGVFKVSGVGSVALAETKMQRMLIDREDGGVTRDQIQAVSPILKSPVPMMPIALIDADSDGVFEKYNYMGKKGKIKNPVFVNWEQSNRSSGYRRELVYQGRDGDNLKLFYREYNNDFARPAYDQEVQYDLGKSEYVQFKGLTILVEEANNEYLVYTIEGGSL